VANNQSAFAGGDMQLTDLDVGSLVNTTSMIGKHLAQQQQKNLTRQNSQMQAAMMMQMQPQMQQMQPQMPHAGANAAVTNSLDARRASAAGAPGGQPGGGMNSAMIAAMIAARQQAQVAAQRGTAMQLPGAPDQ
jgi:hypothetical protein